MKIDILGKTGLKVSNICFGAGNFGDTIPEDLAFELMDAYAAAGGNFLDTANIYGKWLPAGENVSEQIVGRWLKSRGMKQRMVVATKGGHYDLNQKNICRVTREEIKKDLNESRLALGLDCIDLYWLHRDNEAVPAGELLEWMEELVKRGDIRYYGASNFRLERMQEADVYAKEHGLQGFCAVSNRWSLAKENPETAAGKDPTMAEMDEAFFDWHCKSGTPSIPYSSTAHGFFAKYEKNQLSDRLNAKYRNPENLETARILKEISAESGLSLFELSLSWLLSQPFQVIPVTTASSASQIQAYRKAGDFVIPEAWMEQLREIRKA